MATVQVEAIGPGEFRVHVTSGGVNTSHRVTIPADFASDLGVPGIDDTRLVEESFAFLLEREPASSILRAFGLPTIGHYFPDYMDDLRRRLR